MTDVRYLRKLSHRKSDDVGLHTYGGGEGFLSVQETDQPGGVVILDKDEARELGCKLIAWAESVD